MTKGQLVPKKVYWLRFKTEQVLGRYLGPSKNGNLVWRLSGGRRIITPTAARCSAHIDGCNFLGCDCAAMLSAWKRDRP